MPCLKVTGIIVRNPDFTVRVFRHENFHRKVDCDTGRSDHPGRSGLRVAKDQELGRAHLKTRLFGLTAVIDQSKEFDTLCGKCFFNPCQSTECWLGIVTMPLSGFAVIKSPVVV